MSTTLFINTRSSAPVHQHPFIITRSSAPIDQHPPLFIMIPQLSEGINHKPCSIPHLRQ
ncbi:MAG: hypothetical protein ACKOA7_04490 [Bacteroidota bacterium]